MRRPRFNRWIRREVLKIAGTRSFSMRKFAARAQRPGEADLAAALLLYAHENGCLDTLSRYLYDEDLAQTYRQVERILGHRSLERLALRGIPLTVLPDDYRRFMDAYAMAYHAPETASSEKEELARDIRTELLAKGVSPSEVARSMRLDAANMTAFVARGDTGRFTLSTARSIRAHVAALPPIA